VARKCDLCDLLFSSVSDGIAVINKQGGIIDVSPALVQATGWRKEDLVGREAAEIVGEMIQPPHSDLMTDYLHKALISREPVRTGCIRLTSKETGADMFVDLTAYPLLSADGDVGEIAVVVRFLTERVDLERQVGEYTENLESLVTARTKDLSSANALLEGAVSKLASLAKSGMVLGSLKDAESVMDSFLVQAKGVLAADFVSVVLVGDKVGVAKTTYYSSGEIPPPGEIPSEVVEKALAHLMLYGSASDVVKTPLNNLMVLDFAISGFRGLLLAWKRDGEFTAIDGNISRLLCTQLGFALPITTYVSQLRKERDRSHAMRRVAFRVVAAGSVGSAIRIVAGEVARAISADRFFWLVLANESDAWLSEVYATGGVSAGRPRRVTLAGSSDLRAAFEAGYDSHQMFCERFPDFGGSGFVAEKATGKVDQCPFVSKDGSLHIAGCMRGMLETAGFLMHDEGWLAAAPVALSHHSWGILCAYREAGGPFSFEDICFVCLAASTVGHMWQAVDSAGAVRRLEAAGETVSELAHDLKYPLMRMRECVAAVAGTDGPRLEADPRMGSLAFEIDRMARLAQELIDIARPGPRRAELVDINETLDYCLELTASDAAARSVDVTKRMDTELPPILASRKDIKTILLNLLANCIDAAGEGGRVEIEAKCDRGRGGPERACLILSDTGPGVSRDNLEKIFDPFYSTKGGGSGLGLFSAKKRANANDGDVECELGQDGKSRFVVWFPMASS
jgi:PAS domain S-box-containing protein